MFSMIIGSVKLFITGRLFANYGQVFLRGILVTVIGAAIIVLVGHVTSALLATLAGGAVSGFLLPLLFKDLKYR